MSEWAISGDEINEKMTKLIIPTQIMLCVISNSPKPEYSMVFVIGKVIKAIRHHF